MSDPSQTLIEPARLAEQAYFALSFGEKNRLWRSAGDVGWRIGYAAALDAVLVARGRRLARKRRVDALHRRGRTTRG